MFHRDRELRFEASLEKYEWPASRSELENAWKKSVEIALAAYREHYPNAILDDQSEAHGYVKIEIENKSFWVPAPIMAFIPSPDDMLKLNDAAQSARMFLNSRICLSGSTVLTGAFKSVGDLDLFEYVPEEAVGQELQNPEPQYRKNEFICTEVSIAETNGEFPKERRKLTGDHIYPEKMRTFAAKYLDGMNFAKINMIGMFNGQVGEITNICYRHPNDWKFEPPYPSFSFQEVLTGDHAPESKAYSLQNFGLYAFWLRDEVEKLLTVVNQEHEKRHALTSDTQRKAIKLAKRSMSLSALLDETELLPDFLSALESKQSRLYALTSSIDVLNPLIAADDNERAAGLAAELADWVSKQMKTVNKEKPAALDIPNLLSAARTLLGNFDHYCHPNLDEEVPT